MGVPQNLRLWSCTVIINMNFFYVNTYVFLGLPSNVSQYCKIDRLRKYLLFN